MYWFGVGVIYFGGQLEEVTVQKSVVLYFSAARVCNDGDGGRPKRGLFGSLWISFPLLIPHLLNLIVVLDSYLREKILN